MPRELVGRLVCAAVVTFVGPEDEARDVVAPLLALRPAAQLIAEMPYADLQSSLDDPPGYRNYWSAEHLPALPDEAVAAFCRVSEQLISPAPRSRRCSPAEGRPAGPPRTTRSRGGRTRGPCTPSACGPTRPTTSA